MEPVNPQVREALQTPNTGNRKKRTLKLIFFLKTSDEERAHQASSQRGRARPCRGGKHGSSTEAGQASRRLGKKTFVATEFHKGRRLRRKQRERKALQAGQS